MARKAILLLLPRKIDDCIIIPKQLVLWFLVNLIIFICEYYLLLYCYTTINTIVVIFNRL